MTSCEIMYDPDNAGKVSGTLDLNSCIGVEHGTHTLVWETKLVDLSSLLALTTGKYFVVSGPREKKLMEVLFRTF